MHYIRDETEMTFFIDHQVKVAFWIPMNSVGVYVSVSYANDVACKSLDWLEASFSVIVSSTEQVTFPFLV